MLHVQRTPCIYIYITRQFNYVYYIVKALKFTYLLQLHLKTDFHVECSYPYLTCGIGQRSAVVFTERKPTRTARGKNMSNLGYVIFWTFKRVCVIVVHFLCHIFGYLNITFHMT